MKNVNVAAQSVLVDEATAPYHWIIPAILEPHENSNLDSMERKFHPMVDPTIPFRNLHSAESKKKSLRRLIRKLDVHSSTRYKRTPEDTYCNVYSFDYCHFAKVYLPTVWWTEEAIELIRQGQEVTPVFNETVMPIYSNAIHDWFLQWGESFGWKRYTDLTAIQEKVTQEGGIGIICAKRKIAGLSGHIVPIVPETEKKKAFRENGHVLYPLQSQAGKLNYNYFARKRRDWWNHERYSSYVLFYHD
jgi:hypothetical protein